MTATNLEGIARENFVTRPFKRVVYAIRPRKLVLDKEQYCHIFDKKTGQLSLIEGPIRRFLSFDEEIKYAGVKYVVPEKSFCIVENPIDKDTGGILYGEREVRTGPVTFSLHPGEELEDDIEEEYTLTQYEGLLLKALKNTANHKAGDKYLIKGPVRYVPTKDEEVINEVKAIPLSHTDGIYVQNQDTGEVRLIKGPVDYFLQPNETLFEKEITEDELEALGLKPQTSREVGSREGVRVLTRQAANKSFLENRSNALVLELEESEVVYLYDGTAIRIEKGPKTTFLEPYERPKILNLSGGRPIKQNALKIGLLKLGPDFIYDRIDVRTKDNALLTLDLTYKWRFKEDHDLKKLFSLEDFVGYAAETLSSEIRSVAAQYDFEDFHANCLDYVNERIFGGNQKSRVFDENNLEVFGIDITSINPKDPKVAEKLHEAIKSNMDIYCRKLILNATLEAEKREVEGKKKIEEERAKLIEAQLANKRKQATEEAKIEAEVDLIKYETEAKGIEVVRNAKIEAERRRLQTIIAELSKDGSRNYLELRRSETFEDAEKLVIVPTDSKIVLPYARDGSGED